MSGHSTVTLRLAQPQSQALWIILAGVITGTGGLLAGNLTGTLLGKQGSFVLMHTGTMNRGAAQLAVQVVPDSGTDALTGLTGQMDIQVTGGQHVYTFDFTLP